MTQKKRGVRSLLIYKTSHCIVLRAFIVRSPIGWEYELKTAILGIATPWRSGKLCPISEIVQKKKWDVRSQNKSAKWDVKSQKMKKPQISEATLVRLLWQSGSKIRPRYSNWKTSWIGYGQGSEVGKGEYTWKGKMVGPG